MILTPPLRPVRAGVLVLSILATLSTARASTRYVDANLASGANDGSSWADAFQGSNGLQLALAAAAAGDQVWAADGLYEPTPGTDRTISFVLANGVELYGGFAGGETSLSQRDPAANVALLSGDLLGDDGSSSFGENSYHVVRGNGAGASAILDGFTVTGGNADGPSASDDDRGGGFLMVSGSSATIARCVVRENRCVFGGGAGYVRQSSPSFTECVFESNLGGSFGGAFDMFNGVASVLRRCTFRSNSAARAGGVEIFSSSPVKVYDCLFTNNTSSGGGGGGAIYSSGSGSQIRGCTITGNNSLVHQAAGILIAGGGATVANTIAYGNTGPGGAQNAVNQISGGLTSYCCVQNGTGGTGNISADPLFVNPGGGDFSLANGSPCIDAGGNSFVPAISTVDFAGNPRVADEPTVADSGAGERPIVDMGAYERRNTLYAAFCFGDGSTPTACPCGNTAPTGHGCLNSDALSNGATLFAEGTSAPDTVVLTANEVLSSVTCIFLQGTTSAPSGVPFGDGVRCTTGILKRLYVKTSSASGSVSAPAGGDPSITVQSAALGDPISPLERRTYQVWYRDSSTTFCPSPAGDVWNVSGAVRVAW